MDNNRSAVEQCSGWRVSEPRLFPVTARQERIRARQADRRFGENVATVVRALRQAKEQT